MNEVERAYLAGIIDGEGAIAICRKKATLSHPWETYQPYIEVANIDEKLIDFLAAKIPYGFRFKRLRQQTNSKWRDAHCFQVTGLQHIIHLLEQLKPYLIVKREHAELMIEYCKSRLKHCLAGNRERSYNEKEIELYNKLRTLNHGKYHKVQVKQARSLQHEIPVYVGRHNIPSFYTGCG